MKDEFEGEWVDESGQHRMDAVNSLKKAKQAKKGSLHDFSSPDYWPHQGKYSEKPDMKKAKKHADEAYRSAKKAQKAKKGLQRVK